MRLFFAFAILILNACSPPQPNATKNLNEGWQFYNPKDENFYSAEVPGSVQSDLVRHNLLGNPLEGTNELSNQWVEQEEWMYALDLKKSDLPDRKNITFDFDGLDTYVQVLWNNKLVLETNNMFRKWSFTIGKADVKKENKLIVNFLSPMENGVAARAQFGDTLPSPNDSGAEPVSPYIRKAPYQFGWDWGPRCVTSGIWRDVSMTGWDDVLLTDFIVSQVALNPDIVKAKATFEINSISEKELAMDLTCDGMRFGKKIALKKGKHDYQLNFDIQYPKLWWPNGKGEQHLSRAEGKIVSDGIEIGKKTQQVGWRNIELRQETDSIGTSFEFIVNGKPVFAKGANYIPQSVIPSAVSEAKYRKLLIDAKEANMNMIRVWGGGIYENDIFYDLCDSLGLMVWQDFMFAGALYPGNDAFLDNVKTEVEEQVKRISKHASVALWCGNNEIDVAWNNWGWKSSFSENENEAGKSHKDIEKAYNDVFKSILPNAVDSFGNGIPYIHTSPLSNWGTDENFNHHNMHYWGVWHGADNFDGFQKHIPRFMSEYGFQSFPMPNAFAGQLRPYQLSIDSLEALKRQKSYKTTGELIRHLEQHYPMTEDFAEFCYLTQLNQAQAMRMAIDAHRLNNDRCRGTLYWQLNDVWAGPTWSTIDHAGNWKAGHYTVRDRYKDVVVIFEETETDYECHVVNDSDADLNATLLIELRSFSGRTALRSSVDISAAANSRYSFKWKSKDEEGRMNRENKFYRQLNYIYLKLEQDSNTIAETNHYLCEPKDFLITEPNIELTSALLDNGDTQLKVKSDTHCIGLYLWSEENPNIKWKENFFDLRANEEKIVYQGNEELGKIKFRYLKRSFKMHGEMPPECY